MGSPVPAIPQQSASITDLLAQLDKMIGGGKTSTTSTTTPDAGALDQQQLLLQKIFADINPGSIDAMVGNILDRAKQAFGPAAIGANAAGTRAYSDTVLASLRNEAMARATGESTKAALDAINEANKTAASLVNTRVNSSKSTNTASRTGPSDLGKAAGLLTLGSAGLNIYKKLKNVNQSNIPTPDEGSTGGSILDDLGFGGPDGGGITSVEGGVGGTSDLGGGILAAIEGTNLINNSTSSPDTPVPTEDDITGALPAGEELSTLETQAQQGLEGAGELSEVSSLTGLPDADTLATLSAQAQQGTEGAGELSEVPALGATAPDVAGSTLASLNAASGVEAINAAEPGSISMGIPDTENPEFLTATTGTAPDVSGSVLSTLGASSGVEAVNTAAPGSITMGLPEGETSPFLEPQLTTQVGSTPITDISALDSTLPSIEEMTELSQQADLGLQGAGELSEVANLGGSELGLSGLAGAAVPVAGIAAGAADVAANPQTNAITEALAGMTGFGGIINSLSGAFGDDNSYQATNAQMLATLQANNIDTSPYADEDGNITDADALSRTFSNVLVGNPDLLNATM